MKSKEGAQLKKLWGREWFGQNIRHVVLRWDVSNQDGAIVAAFPNVMITYVDMFGAGMKDLVLGKNARSLVVTEKRCWSVGREIDTSE